MINGCLKGFCDKTVYSLSTLYKVNLPAPVIHDIPQTLPVSKYLVLEGCRNAPEHRTSQFQEMRGFQRQTIKAWTAPSLPVTTVNTGRGCVGEGMSKCHILFVKQQSQDCRSLFAFWKAREVNKICDAFCCCNGELQRSEQESKWYLTFFGFPLSLSSVFSLIPHKAYSFHLQRQENIQKNFRTCLVEILPLALPKLNNERTIFLILHHVVGYQNKGEKKQWLLMELTGRENGSLFSNLGDFLTSPFPIWKGWGKSGQNMVQSSKIGLMQYYKQLLGNAHF